MDGRTNAFREGNVNARRFIFPVLCVSAAALTFALGYLIGADQALDHMEQRAIDEGYAVRDPDFRWRTSQELDRKPERSRRAKE
jgi:hypothetical protein